MATVVEHAIARWARGNRSSSDSSSSSSSSSSGSSRPSITTASRSFRGRRKRRRTSIANSHTDLSEIDISARILMMKAREESRQTPRQFNLYLPPSLTTVAKPSINPLSPPQRITRTTSLPAILGQLDLALKKSTKARRNLERKLAPKVPPRIPEATEPSPLHHNFMHPNAALLSRPASPTNVGVRPEDKGKHRDIANRANVVPNPSKTRHIPKAWFLDVASPTSDDMQAIGKLLHLHPLTLEDILQQDPREKLELFPKLGYYFVSFRTVERRAIHDGAQGEANVYLVVFQEGICTFHFTDISEHIERVMNRLVQFEEAISMSSDWIAHGILDSVVDSFFPFVEEIEREVEAIEQLAFSGGSTGNTTQEDEMHNSTTTIVQPSVRGDSEDKRSQQDPDIHSQHISEKNLDTPPATKTRFVLPGAPHSMLLRRLRRFIGGRWRGARTENTKPSTTPTPTPLRRMARARRLVTSIARLLATKSEVIAQVRKRLLTGLGSGSSKAEDIEVAIYMGDIQDHILTLQHSLAHYERMLSQLHPVYISQLRTNASMAKSGTDRALIFLTVISVAVLCIQPLIGTFSVNVTMPTNGHEAGDPYNLFGIVLVGACIILAAYLALVRKWWIQAQRRRSAGL